MSQALKTLKIFGATGSIGKSFQSVIRQFPDQFSLVGASSYSQLDGLRELAHEFRPQLAVLAKNEPKIDQENGISYGEDAMHALAALPAEICVIAISGSAGLQWALNCLPSCRRLALANKESLVMGADLLLSEAKRHGVEILPIDSEHSALLQLLASVPKQDVRSVTLTASGGPFWQTKYAELDKTTPEDALKHPVWQMGQKITIDSATMMNKGLEIIEAHHLFGIQSKDIAVLVHPQSIVHAMVETISQESLVLAGVPNMRASIALALTWPARLPNIIPAWFQGKDVRWDFFPPDPQRFPCPDLARSALIEGNVACITLNAANEIAVARFLRRQIGFQDIPRLIAHCLEQEVINSKQPRKLSAILEIHDHVIKEAWAWRNSARQHSFPHLSKIIPT